MIFQALFQYFTQGRQPLNGRADTTPQKHVDLARFCGRWYELARFDNFFQRGLEDVHADYTLTRNGRLHILNSGVTARGRHRSAHAGAYVPHADTPGLLRVSFVPPYRWFYTDYRILFVDDAYRTAIVSGTDSRNLWLMARSPFVPPGDFLNLLRIAQSRWFRTENLHFTHHRPQGQLGYTDAAH